MTTKTQLRGICQCCGREQAVVRGKMSKHGYTVEEGWFNGVCAGNSYVPMQHSRTTADEIAQTVENDAADLRALAESLKAGKAKPAKAKSGERIRIENAKGFPWGDEYVAFADAPKHYQDEAVRNAIWQTERRAQAGEDFVRDLRAMADEYHGKELREVVLAEAPAPVERGEKRVYTREDGSTVTLTVSHREGARVYYRNPQGREGWKGLAAWRCLPLAD